MGASGAYVFSQVAVDDDVWHHIACVRDGDVAIRIYVDGVLKDSTTPPSGSISNNQDPYIGSMYTYNRAWEGNLDEIAIHNKALTPSEFYGLYNYPDIDNIAGLWSFDKGSGSTAYDFSDNDNDGTLKPTDSEPTWVNGFNGKALDFDGDNDYVEVADDDSLDMGTGDFTVECWIKTAF